MGAVLTGAKQILMDVFDADGPSTWPSEGGPPCSTASRPTGSTCSTAQARRRAGSPCASAPCPPAMESTAPIADRAQDVFGPTVSGWGMSETWAFVSCDPAVLDRASSAARLRVPHDRLRVPGDRPRDRSRAAARRARRAARARLHRDGRLLGQARGHRRRHRRRGLDAHRGHGASSAPTATSCSWAATRTCSRSAARTCRRPRSRRYLREHGGGARRGGGRLPRPAPGRGAGGVRDPRAGPPPAGRRRCSGVCGAASPASRSPSTSSSSTPTR